MTLTPLRRRRPSLQRGAICICTKSIICDNNDSTTRRDRSEDEGEGEAEERTKGDELNKGHLLHELECRQDVRRRGDHLRRVLRRRRHLHLLLILGQLAEVGRQLWRLGLLGKGPPRAARPSTWHSVSATPPGPHRPTDTHSHIRRYAHTRARATDARGVAQGRRARPRGGRGVRGA